MKAIKNFLSATLILVCPIGMHGQEESAYMPKFTIKTNTVYLATATANLGFELGLSPKLTLDLSGSYNPWRFSDHKQFKHWLIQPELRYWLHERFNGHFFGMHAHYAGVNVSNLFGTGHKRYQGYIYGAGISYGYQWAIGKRWSMEAEIGIGYAHVNYDRYDCGKCKSQSGRGHKNYFGPTKVALNIIYAIK